MGAIKTGSTEIRSQIRALTSCGAFAVIADDTVALKSVRACVCVRAQAPATGKKHLNAGKKWGILLRPWRRFALSSQQWDLVLCLSTPSSFSGLVARQYLDYLLVREEAALHDPVKASHAAVALLLPVHVCVDVGSGTFFRFSLIMSTLLNAPLFPSRCHAILAEHKHAHTCQD